MSAKRFRIAFSFAEGARAFVAKVANLLAECFGSEAILYDKFHEAEFARRNLGIYLPDLYHDDSDLAVVVVCPDYENREWCGLEWTAIHDLLKRRKDDEVMLSRFGGVTLKGVYSTAGWVELDNKSPDQAAILILERLALTEGKSRDTYTKLLPFSPSFGACSIPNNLLRLSLFFGRAAELKALGEALDPAAQTWGMLIAGPAGMGKTSLAIRAASECPTDKFRRIIFISAKQRELHDDGVRQLTGFRIPGLLEVLNELARELGRSDISEAPVDQRIRLLVEALRPAQALLILDNLEALSKSEQDEILVFVKRLPQGCKAILTSRLPFGSGSELLNLDELDAEAALATLGHLARQNGRLARTSLAERMALYEQTGGRPLMLCWVAGQLGRGSCSELADALKFLRSCPRDDCPLEFIFGDLAKDFTEPEDRVLCALSHFAMPATVNHIAELTATEKDSAATTLRALTNRSLVVPDQEDKTYALVPMVGEFLRKHRPRLVSEAACRLESLASALIEENGGNRHDLFPTLEAYWPAVFSALPFLVAGPNQRLQIVCNALYAFLNFTGHWDELRLLNAQAEEKALMDGDLLHAIRRAYQTGLVHHRRGEADQVFECSGRAAAYEQNNLVASSDPGLAAHLQGLGFRLRKDYMTARAFFQEALALAQSVSAESRNVAIFLADLASAELDSGDPDLAEKDLLEALRISKDVGEPEVTVGCMSRLTRLALSRSDWPAAEPIAREALILAERLGRHEFIADNCHRLAVALVKMSRSAEANVFAKRAVEIYSRLRHPELKGARATLEACSP